MTGDLTMDADHVYTFKGGVVPSCTQVLSFAGLRPPDFIPEEVMQHAIARGNVMHDICAMILRGTLDWSSVDPAFMARAESFAERVEEAGLEPHAIEQAMYSANHGVAGTPDFVGMAYGVMSIMDHKNGARGYVAPQTAFYKLLAIENGHPVRHRYVCEWKGDRCRFRQLEDDNNDWLDFAAALRLYRRWAN